MGEPSRWRRRDRRSNTPSRPPQSGSLRAAVRGAEAASGSAQSAPRGPRGLGVRSTGAAAPRDSRGTG